MNQHDKETVDVSSEVPEDSAKSNGAPTTHAADPIREDEARDAPPPSPKPPRGPRLWIILIVLVAAGAALWVGTVWGDPIGAGFERVWQAMGGGDPEEVTAEASADDQFWTCGMHPWVILPEPGECPICHMDLVPLDPGKLTGELTIDPVVVQNIGVRIAPVVTGPLTREIRTVGTVTYDETRVRDVNTKVAGWIEELYVDYEGVEVEQGEPLFELYSPELYTAQKEYLLAYENRDEIGADFLPSAAEGARSLLEAARTRLEYFDISEEQVRELQETGEPTKTLTVTSPHTGIVIDKHANEGMRIEPGMRVYRIADLSTVWVQATIYEHQLPFVEVGQRAVMTLPYLPGQVLEGEVVYIYPYLNEGSRQVKVRLEFENPDGLLKPGMFATVELENTLDERAVLAPAEAVIGTGEREVAFVSLGGGKFEPREVDVGVQTGDGMIHIVDGLEPGEQVVTSGQFLLDSESKMRAALAKMVKGDLAADQDAAVPIAGSSELSDLPPAAADALSSLISAYLDIGEALAADTTEGAARAAEQIVQNVDALIATDLPTKPDFWDRHDQEIQAVRASAQELADGPGGLEEARVAYGVLSDAMGRVLLATGVPPSYQTPMDMLVCGMFADVPHKGVWLQPADLDLRNPYMGAVMPDCNQPDRRRRLPVTGQKADGQAESDATPTERPSEQISDREPLPEPAADLLGVTLGAYFEIGDALAANTTEGVAPRAREIATALDALVDVQMPGEPDFWQEHPETAAARGKTLELAETEGLDQARRTYAGLSKAISTLFYATGVPTSLEAPVQALMCPMYPKGEGGAVWLQPAGETRNPYMGEGPMLGCVGERETLPAAGGERSGTAPDAAPPAVAPDATPAALMDGADVPPAARRQVGRLMEAYMSLQRMLFANEYEGAQSHLQTIIEAAGELAEVGDRQVGQWAQEVAEEAAATEADDLASLRATFKTLSAAVIELAEAVPSASEAPEELYEVYCPMAKGAWLQPSREVSNPYYGVGHDMHDCGEIRQVIGARQTQRSDP